MGPYDSEWTVHVLEDLQAFFIANQMPVAAHKSKELQRIIQDEVENRVIQLEDWRAGRSM